MRNHGLPFSVLKETLGQNMIDINFSNPIGQIRAIIGDPTTEFITDTTITSALALNGNNQPKTCIFLMEMMLTAFSTLADREREGMVEVYYTNLFERYKIRLDDLKRSSGYKKAVPIYIGGTSLEVKNKNVESLDSFSQYQLPDWHNIQLGNKTLVEQELYRLKL